LVGIVAWPVLDPTRFAPGPHPSTSANGPAGSDQPGGESRAAKDTFAPDDATGGRARELKHTAEPLSLTPEQRERLRALIGQDNLPRADELPFSLQVGAAVPRQVELRDLPPEASRILNGYAEDQYVVIRGKLVIVDHLSRRVAAIIPDVA
jgi:Protein of unknown function (DUF1236)